MNSSQPDFQKILDQILQSGKTVAAKGEEMFGDKIGIPASGAERDAMLKGLGKGAAAAGVLALVLGTGAGRRLAGTALKLGSLAAVGGLGYTAYKNWQAKNGGTGSFGKPISELGDTESVERSRKLLRAMIAAAKADGHIDPEERATIEKQLQGLDLGPDLADFLSTEIDKPLDAREIGAIAGSTDEAVEMWLASRLVLDPGNVDEGRYLDELTRELNLDSGLVAELEASVSGPSA